MRDQYLDIGKRGELHVFGELLKRGVVPYVPMVDREGIDAVVTRESGTYVAIQVKTCVSGVSPRWFAISRLEPRPNLYIVCVALNLSPVETWIIPSDVFAANATRSKSGHLDLDLNGRPRGETVTRAEKLKGLLDAWHLLTREDEFGAVSDEAFAEDWSSKEDAAYDRDEVSHA